MTLRNFNGLIHEIGEVRRLESGDAEKMERAADANALFLKISKENEAKKK